jgi:hypothetical protein
MRRAFQQRLPVAAGAATLTVFLAAVILLPKTRSLPRGFLIDDNLDDHSLDELRDWAARKVNFVVIDSDTGEDITWICWLENGLS